MLLGVTFYLQNNFSGLLAKALWVLPPHNPNCAIACNSKQKQSKPYSTLTLVLVNVLVSQNHGVQKKCFTTELSPCITQFLFRTSTMPGIFQGSDIVTINLPFCSAHHENSFSLHSVVAKYAFSLY